MIMLQLEYTFQREMFACATSSIIVFFPQNLGSLEISMRFEPREGCLVIAVERGVGLPEHQIKGPPGRSPK